MVTSRDRLPSDAVGVGVVGADGRVALEVVYAAYISAGRGERVHLPLQLSDEEAATAPYLLWKGRRATPT
jgi:hypothetical protein